MRRRRFLQLVIGTAAAGAVGCATDGDGQSRDEPGAAPDAAPPSPDAAPAAADARQASTDACQPQTVMVYDTYAQALYLDGSLGPLTGVIEAEYLADGQPVELDFWHGHNGQQHRFTVGPAEFARLLAGQRIYVETTEVESHSHMLFIDPGDPDYRVPGAEPVPVPIPGSC